MKESEVSYKCHDCGKQLSSKEMPCSSCGSTKRDIAMKVIDTIEIHDFLKTTTKKKINGKTKVTNIQKVGDSYFMETGRWHSLVRVIDRIKDWYYELIKDKKTEEIIRYENGKLSEHQGYGSAKYKNRK